MHAKQTLLAVAVMAIIGSTNLAMAAPTGDTSNSTNVVVNVPSNFPPPMATGNSGLRMLRHTDGQLSGSVDIHNAPINQVNTTIAAGPDGNGDYWANQPGGGTIAQVWKASNTVANIYSLRQVDTITDAGWPQFGGLVIGQVKDASGDAYSLGSGVYFGEWSKQDLPTNPLTSSTDLNMADASRTVWYVGDDPLTDMKTYNIDAEYAVVGIARTGEANGPNANLPSAPDLYTGTLAAYYSQNAGGDISGTISNSVHTIDFDGTNIHQNNGTFSNGSTIRGQFYNGAEALAGIYTGGAGTADDVAFGGSYNGTGTITP